MEAVGIVFVLLVLSVCHLFAKVLGITVPVVGPEVMKIKCSLASTK